MHIVDLENRVNLEQAVSLSLKFKKMLYLRLGFVLSLQNAIFWVSMLDSVIVFLLQCAVQVSCYSSMFYNWYFWLPCCLMFVLSVTVVDFHWYSWLTVRKRGKEVIWNQANSNLSKNGSYRNDRIKMESSPIWNYLNTSLCTVNSCYNVEDLRQDHLMLGLMFCNRSVSLKFWAIYKPFTVY